MSQDRKIVKIFSFVAFAIGMVRIMTATNDIMRGGAIWALLLQDFGSGAALVLCSYFGIRGANQPSCAGQLVLFTTIGAAVVLALSVLSVVVVANMGLDYMPVIPSGVITVAALLAWRFFAVRVRDTYANRI